jgi:SNF2 family DNA or RNA helicase
VRETFEGERAVAFAARLDGWDGRVEGHGTDAFRLAPPLAAHVHTDPAAFDVRFESGGRAADPARVLAAWRAGASLVPLVGDGWAALPGDWLDRHGHRLADLLAARDAAGRLTPAAVVDLAALCAELDQAPPPAFERLRALVDGFDGIPAATLPADLAAELRAYQRRGVDWLAFLREARLGALLADDMGLGKTLQALCAITGRTLVVCPTSVMHNWAAEVRRFRPRLSLALYHGPKRELDPVADVTLTTYALLRLDADRLAAERWDTVVLDEAQAIKNPDSQVAAAAYRLDAGWRVALTGTPVENRLEELWSQLHFLDPGLLGGRRDFDERYAAPIASGDSDAVRRLRERIRPFVLRRLKQEVAPELPPRIEVVLRCELGPDEREVYDAIRASTVAGVVRRLGEGGSVLEALEALLRLRQAACHSGLVPGVAAERSSKTDLLLESLDSVVAEDHKALVFSQWTSLLDRIEPHLERASIAFARLDGATRDRAAVVATFQDPAGPPVLLVSLRAGGTGLNLTAADHVFLLDPWWNPAVEDQAADRAHRIGQERPVLVHRLVATDTVEERILVLQERKRELARAAFDDTAAAGRLTREDLLELLT